MANLDDLGLENITEMSPDEAIELIRQIRLSRRIPDKPKKSPKSKKLPTPALDADQAAELLKLLKGTN